MDYAKYIVPRKKGAVVRFIIAITAISSLILGWILSDYTARALLLPKPVLNLDHYRVNRSLKSYLDQTSLLIQPSTKICHTNRNLSVVAMVTTSPFNFEQRRVIRNTWGKYVPTFFLMGLPGPTVEDLMVENYVEAKEHGDVIVYLFQDHYQNLTLKSALMMKWTLEWCPLVGFLFKTDDDVLVNPWIMHEVITSARQDPLVGYRKEKSYFHRDEYNKWYMPRWLYRQDFISEYLSGTGYLINGNQIEKILNKAYEIPMINLEDIYFTYLVAKSELGLNLTHDYRLSPYKPWTGGACFYWGLASAHSLSASEMSSVWPHLEDLGREYENGKDVCPVHMKYWSEIFLY